MVCRLAVCALLLVAGTVRAEEAQRGGAIPDSELFTGAAEKSPCGGGACNKSKADGQTAHAGCTKSLTALAKPEKCCAGDTECAGCEKSGGKCDRCCATGAKALTLDDALVQAAAITFNVASAAPAPCAPRPVNGAVFSPTQELLQQKLAQRDELQREIDELCESTKTCQQVLVRVKVMEVSLTKMRKLGIDFAPGYHVFNSDEFATSETDSCASECSGGECCTEECRAEKCCSEKCGTETCSSKPCGTEKCNAAKSGEETCGDGECCAEKSSCQACSHCTDDDGLASFLEALEEKNIAKVLADPTVVTVSGRPASFQVGGEVPIPVPGSSAYTFKDFGTKLDLLAVAQGGNKVRLEIRSCTSEICDDRSMVVEGNTIPSLRTNKYDTACDLEFGQTWVLAGLTSRRTEAFQTEDGVRERTNDVMQVLIVTPEFVTSTARRSTVTK